MPEKYDPRKLPVVIDSPAEPDLVEWPKPPSKARYRWLVVIVVAAAGAVYLIFIRGEDAKQATEPGPAGWYELLDCSYTVSLDGSKELNLFQNQRAVMYDKAKKNERGKYITVDGTWGFEEATKLYTITLNGESENYSIAEPGQGLCMLVKGDLASADLRTSWFSLPVDGEPGDDREHDAPGL